MTDKIVPCDDYGVLHRTTSDSDLDLCVEEVSRNGFSLLRNCLKVDDQVAIEGKFNDIHSAYIKRHSMPRLESVDELNTVRCPMLIDTAAMFNLAANAKLLEVVSRLIAGRFVLNQQNLIINPSKQGYNQGSWHRDLPYQHFVSSTPLSVNAIYCVDEFSATNGASFVMPGSHREPAFPSKEYVSRNAVQIEASAGSIILMDSMIFHSGGFNNSDMARRAINQVYSIPYIKQQICLPSALSGLDLNDEQLALIGNGLDVPRSPDEYLQSRLGNSNG